jgi:ABC-type phosphate/phosphonate transport system substrate-binding protein
MSTVRVGVARSVGVTRVPAHMYDAAVTLARLERFCGALQASTGLVATPVQTRSYAELEAALGAREVELAWLPPFVALHCCELGLATPLLAPVRGESSTFYAALFVRKQAKLAGADDLAGTRAAWVDRASAAGYVVVRAALRRLGLDPDRLFTSQSFEGSHQAVVQAVLEGTADVGATYLHRGPWGALQHAGWGNQPVRPIFEHGPIPADVLAAARGVDAEIAALVARALVSNADADLGAAARELFEATRFVRIDAAHLAPLAELVSHLDRDPAMAQSSSVTGR